MRLLSLLAALAAALLFAAAGSAPMTAAEAQRTFFGIDMAGVMGADRAPWRECVTPAGETRFWFRGDVDEGRLRIRDDGALCFSYARRNFADEGCYRAFREGRDYRFVLDGPAAETWVTRSFRTNVKTCEGLDAIS